MIGAVQMEPKTHHVEPTEAEINAAEKLPADGEFAAASKKIESTKGLLNALAPLRSNAH
jgi:hypothetical protein